MDYIELRLDQMVALTDGRRSRWSDASVLLRLVHRGRIFSAGELSTRPFCGDPRRTKDIGQS